MCCRVMQRMQRGTNYRQPEPGVSAAGLLLEHQAEPNLLLSFYLQVDELCCLFVFCFYSKKAKHISRNVLFRRRIVLQITVYYSVMFTFRHWRMADFGWLFCVRFKVLNYWEILGPRSAQSHWMKMRIMFLALHRPTTKTNVKQKWLRKRHLNNSNQDTMKMTRGGHLGIKEKWYHEFG